MLKKRIKSLFTVNIPGKLFSVLLAFIVWLLVVNINNPAQSRNFTTNVNVVNEGVLREQGKFYTIPEGANTVTFRVTAPRSIIERLSSDDFRATADMANLEEDSRVPVEIRAINHVNQISISNRRHYLNVEIGEEKEEKFVIIPVSQGEPANGFVVDQMKVEPNVITIKGPEPIVSQIDQVVAICDITGMNYSISENVVPTLLDAAGNRIDLAKLSLSLSTVNISISFTNVKDVPVVLEDPQADNQEVEISNISIEPERVKIKGDSELLNNITEIILPTTVIDLASITQNVTTTVDISRYLPEGVTLAVDQQPEVKVMITVSSEKRRTLRMPTQNITVRNLDSTKTYQFEGETVNVEIFGLPSVINEVNGESLTGQLNLSGLSNGEYNLRVEMDSEEGFTIMPVTVKVVIKNGE